MNDYERGNEFEKVALRFFPNWMDGTVYRNRRLHLVRGNTRNPKDIDLRLYDDDGDDLQDIAVLDVEERRTWCCGPRLPGNWRAINIPVHSMAYNTGLIETPVESGKHRYFSAFPERSFFVAVCKDEEHAAMVWGGDLRNHPPEPVNIHPDRQAQLGLKPQIDCHRIPLSRCIVATAYSTDFQDFVMHMMKEAGCWY